MSERKYTDEEIINTLWHHADTTARCENCLYTNHQEGCSSRLAKDALDLINRKNAEIERLTIELDAMRSAANSLKMHYENARADAIKEFAERLKEERGIMYPFTNWVHIADIALLVAEMTAGDK